MTNIICLLYVGWVTNYMASVYVRVQEPVPAGKLEEDKGETIRIIERLDRLEMPQVPCMSLCVPVYLLLYYYCR
ncbi:hypothetical protein GDO86_008836 [Hymenochirus boettgeri]|uniref:Uncharacterized protein n=1 Tax=Hymenochirus boettgeri TaxID=247094 RepID=A0A8T2J3B8_9PIPI|nr:hypothetical protein GDO86_008836 [Hymenochirus boettgeri]